MLEGHFLWILYSSLRFWLTSSTWLNGRNTFSLNASHDVINTISIKMQIDLKIYNVLPDF